MVNIMDRQINHNKMYVHNWLYHMCDRAVVCPIKINKRLIHLENWLWTKQQFQIHMTNSEQIGEFMNDVIDFSWKIRVDRKKKYI